MFRSGCSFFLVEIYLFPAIRIYHGQLASDYFLNSRCSSTNLDIFYTSKVASSLFFDVIRCLALNLKETELFVSLLCFGVPNPKVIELLGHFCVRQ